MVQESMLRHGKAAPMRTKEKCVGRADTPDSVHAAALLRGRQRVTAIHLGRTVTRRLGATHPHTQRAASLCAYLVLLRAEIARFTRPSRRLVSVALILTSRWGAVSSCAALCSPDVPPAPPDRGTSGGLACSTRGKLSRAPRIIGAVFHEETQRWNSP